MRSGSCQSLSPLLLTCRPHRPSSGSWDMPSSLPPCGLTSAALSRWWASFLDLLMESSSPSCLAPLWRGLPRPASKVFSASYSLAQEPVYHLYGATSTNQGPAFISVRFSSGPPCPSGSITGAETKFGFGSLSHPSSQCCAWHIVGAS